MRRMGKRTVAILAAVSLTVCSVPADGLAQGRETGTAVEMDAVQEAGSLQTTDSKQVTDSTQAAGSLQTTDSKQVTDDTQAAGSAQGTAAAYDMPEATAAAPAGSKRTKSDTEEAPQVTFSADSGAYTEGFQLELGFAQSDAEIYYTTDGSDPSDPENTARIAYSADGIAITGQKRQTDLLSAIDPILFDAVNVTASTDGKSFVSTISKPDTDDIDQCTVIKAAAQYADGTCSAVTTNTYFVGAMADHISGISESCEASGQKLAVMSISMDASDLFDAEKGIYVKGDIFDKALEEYLGDDGEITASDAVDVSRSMDANYKQKGKDWERSTHIDYFESDGTQTTCQLQQDCGIRIQGNYSRSDYQKSFRLYAREDYGKKNFKYGFWDNAIDDTGNVIEKYKKIVLRNGGNCAFTTKFSDAYWQSLMEEIDCDTQSARPCVVYLNGEYWGVYILQDDFCGAYMENKHGVNKDDVVIYKGDAEANRELGYKLDEGELPEGETNENYYFQELEDFMRTHDDLSNQEDFDAFAALVDVESAMDYFATEVWINNKWDWPGKNWSMWKTTTTDPDNPYADGKWRFLVYDVEFGGISGADDKKGNAVKDSRLLYTGTADKSSVNYDKPNVRCFALLMTNRAFRDAFTERLEGFSDGMFAYDTAIARANQFKDTYQPILQQFFDRFPTYWGGTGKLVTADMAINGYSGNTYGTWVNITKFLKGRDTYVSKITAWVHNYYGDETASPSPTAAVTQTPAASMAPSESPVMPPSQQPESTAVPDAAQTPTAAPSASAAPADAGGTATAPVETSGAVPGTQVQIASLPGGVEQLTETDASGETISVKYRFKGVLYQKKANGTYVCLTENHSADTLKRKKKIVIADTISVNGKKGRVVAIQKGAFRGLKKLKQVTIGKHIRKIGKNAFRDCSGLRRVKLSGSGGLIKVGKNAFRGTSRKLRLY